jgi:hypothetical protein
MMVPLEIVIVAMVTAIIAVGAYLSERGRSL